MNTKSNHKLVVSVNAVDPEFSRYFYRTHLALIYSCPILKVVVGLSAVPHVLIQTMSSSDVQGVTTATIAASFPPKIRYCVDEN